MLTSPNSLMMTAVSLSAGSFRSRLRSVVLPEPRKPVSTETGMGFRMSVDGRCHASRPLRTRHWHRNLRNVELAWPGDRPRLGHQAHANRNRIAIHRVNIGRIDLQLAFDIAAIP